MEKNLKKLQNGSDIRGVALEGAEGEAVNLDRDAACRLTLGFLSYLSGKTGKEPSSLRISVGHDSRLSAEALRLAVAGTLAGRGVKVLDCGLASTPAMFMSTVFDGYRCDGAVMITASHLPFNRNGFKYFDRDGGLDKGDIQEIITAAEGTVLESDEICRETLEKAEEKAEKRDLIGDYAAYLREKIIRETAHPQNREKPLLNLKIAVDAGNGAGGFFASKVLEPLGADVSASQFLEPDGHFPNHAPNPENKEAMASICRRVKEAGADLGLIFDTDVDRSSAVDRNGKEISRNAIVGLAAALIAEDHPGTTVVTDSITSDQLTVYLEQCLGLKHLRFKRGYRNVINKAQELNRQGRDSQLAIETSGHAAYKENYFLDDGAYLATKIVIKTAQLKLRGETIDSLLRPLGEPKEAVEYRFPIQTEEFGAYGDKILRELESWIVSSGKAGDTEMKLVQPNYEGVRIQFSRKTRKEGEKEGLEGWCLLRKSLHDPIMPLNVEVSEGSCEEILEILKEFLKRYGKLKTE